MKRIDGNAHLKKLNVVNRASQSEIAKKESEMKSSKKRCPFSSQEDKKLLELVNYYGDENRYTWEMISAHMNGRNSRQCRERYNLFLSDSIKKKVKWTKNEDEILLSKYEMLGPQWKKMEKYFVGRTSYSIKNRYNCLKNKKSKKQEIQNNERNDENDKFDIFNNENKLSFDDVFNFESEGFKAFFSIF